MCCLWNIAMRDYQKSVTTGQTDRQTLDKVFPMCRYASQATQKLVFETKMNLATTMSNKGKNLKVLHLDPAPSPRACDAKEVWATLRLTNSTSLVTIMSTKMQSIALYKWDRIMDQQTDDPITKCLLQTFQAVCIKIFIVCILTFYSIIWENRTATGPRGLVFIVARFSEIHYLWVQDIWLSSTQCIEPYNVYYLQGMCVQM